MTLTDRTHPSSAVGQEQTGPVEAGSPDWRPLPVLLVGTFLIVLDFFIVNVALPSIQRSLHASASALEWVVTGYGLAFAVLLISGGRLGDRFGRRRTFSAGVTLFIVSSAVCGFAPDAALLVGARILQGVGAAMISPNVLSLIGVLYPGPHRVRAITIYGVVMGLGAVCGQIIGGGLIEANIADGGWRAIFLINVPVGAGALLLTRRAVPESKSQQPARTDLVGVVLCTVGLTALVLPLVEGRQLGWPAWTWVSLACCPVILVSLAAHQRALAGSGGSPLLHPSAFKERRLRAGLATQMVCWCSQASFFLVLALYLQDGRGLSPLDSGLVFAILAGSYLVASLRAPRLTIRFGRDLIMAGTLTVAAGNLALLWAVSSDTGAHNLAMLVPGLVLVGAGQGLWITPLTATVLSFADPERAGMISGTLSTMQQIGNSLGVAVIGVVFFDALSRHGYNGAFESSLVLLVVVLATAAILTRLMTASRKPRPAMAAANE